MAERPDQIVPPSTPPGPIRGGRISGVRWWPDLGVHRGGEDALDVEPSLTAKDAARRERLVADAQELRTWLAANPADRRSRKGAVRKSSRTDNESAKMATGKGVIQGYSGVATVDASHQIIVAEQAHGTGSEQELLL
jgi:hypothetical protein